MLFTVWAHSTGRHVLAVATAIVSYEKHVSFELNIIFYKVMHAVNLTYIINF